MLETLVPTGSAYLYDPAAGTWAATGAMTVGRDYATATLLNNGKVLVAGGCTGTACESGGNGGLASAEPYDPALGTWAATGAMNAGRWRHTATLRGGPLCTGASPPTYCGRVIAAGGISTGGLNAVTSADRYDPVAGTWATANSMTAARVCHRATLLTGPGCSPHCGKVLMAGGARTAADWSGSWTRRQATTPRTSRHEAARWTGRHRGSG